MKKFYFTALLCILIAGCATTSKRTDTEKHESSAAIPQIKEISLPKAPKMKEGSRYVFLTFDDGPTPNTDRLLDLLSEYKIKATFFTVGKEILDNDFFDYDESVRLLNRVIKEGHYLGMHSMTHQAKILYKDKDAHLNFLNEMRELQELISAITGGYKTSLYRAPYGTRGSFTKEHIKTMTESDLRCWDWTVDSEDWRRLGTEAVMKKIKEDMEGRKYPDLVVVLMHENDTTIEALPSVIEYFKELKYAFLPYHPDNHFQMNLDGHAGL